MKILKDYKKIAKSMLIESAWDRKFGEPLPTLEDTTKKHQTDAYRPGQPEHKPGDVWQTDSGWAAWRPGDKTAEYGIEDKENAVKWAKGKIDPDSTSGSDDEKEPAGKLGGGDFDRGSDDDEYAISGTDSDDPAGGKGDAWMTGDDDSDSETGKDYVSKFQGTDEPEGGEADDYGVKAGSMADDEEAKQAVQGALQGQASDIEKLKDLGYEAMVDLIQSDEDFDTKVKSYVHAMGESTETSKIHILRETYERIGGK